MAYVRTKTIQGKTYRYLVKSVREGKRVRQVFVSYIGNPPPAAGHNRQGASGSEAGEASSPLPDFTPLPEAVARVRYVMLLRQLGCRSVTFSLRADHKHGDTITRRHAETGHVDIVKVRLHREASVHAIAHETGHVMDFVLQNAHGSGGSLDANFVSHTETLRKLADYTCAHQETSSPDVVRKVKGMPASKARDRTLRQLKRYYEGYVYQADELFARLVAVSLTEPEKAKAIVPAAYGWLKETLYHHDRIRANLIEVGLWAR